MDIASEKIAPFSVLTGSPAFIRRLFGQIRRQAMLLAVLSIVVSGCFQDKPVIDPNDPIEQPGPYSAQISELEWPDPLFPAITLRASFYQPQTVAEPAPMVMLLPGFGARHFDYRAYAHQLASHGIAVLGFTPGVSSINPFDGQHDVLAAQIIRVLDLFLLSAEAQAIDPNRLGLLGHSLGGKLAFYAASLDPRFSLVMALDPVNSGGPPCIIAPDWCAAYPVAPNPNRALIGELGSLSASSLILRSRPDSFNPDAEFNARYFFFGSDELGANAVPAPALYLDMGNVPHTAYLPGILAGINEAFVKRTITAYARQHFFADVLDDYLTGSIMQSSINNGLLLGFQSR